MLFGPLYGFLCHQFWAGETQNASWYCWCGVFKQDVQFELKDHCEWRSFFVYMVPANQTRSCLLQCWKKPYQEQGKEADYLLFVHFLGERKSIWLSVHDGIEEPSNLGQRSPQICCAFASCNLLLIQLTKWMEIPAPDAIYAEFSLRWISKTKVLAGGRFCSYVCNLAPDLKYVFLFWQEQTLQLTLNRYSFLGPQFGFYLRHIDIIGIGWL